MIKFDLTNLFFQGLPETIAIAALVCALIGQRLDWKKIFAVGVLQVLTIYLIRLLPITFGIHTFLGIFTLAIYSHLIYKHNLLNTIISSIVCIVLLMLLENLIQQPILLALDLTMEEANKNDLLWILMGWPQVIGLLAAALLTNRYNLRKGRVVNG
ncbi:MAG: hypothetical protein HPY50_21365 [Firmicutes bacterium]|nr:hypothetical protein [Bacillota bacterium]